MTKSKSEAQRYKQENERFIRHMSQSDDVQTLSCGVLYKILEEGGGRKPTTANSVIVDYKGSLIDGTEFDSTYRRGRPAQFKVIELIKGWREALKAMPCGSKWEIYIPYDLAYGTKPCGEIPAYSALIFTVELLDIRK